MLLRSVFRAIIAALLGLLGVPLLVGLAILLRPSLAVNDRTIAWARDYLARSAKLELRWSRLELKVESLSFARKRVVISGKDVCARAPEWEACSETLNVEGVLDFSRGIPSIEGIGPADLQGTSLRIAPASSAGGSGFRFPEVIRKTRFERIRIGFKTWEIAIGERRIEGHGSFKGSGEAKGRMLVWAETRIRAAGLALPSGNVKLQAEFTRDRIRGLLDAEAEIPASRFPRVRISQCRFDLTRSMKLDCPVEIAIPRPPKQLVFLKIPARLGAKVTADLRTPSFPPDPSRRWNGSIGLEVQPALTPMLEVRGRVSARVSAVPLQLFEGLETEIELGLSARIPKFREWVKVLRQTRYAVPAPFQALDGSVEFTLSGRLDREKGRIPFQLATRLASRDQRLNLDAKGAIHLVSGLQPAKPLEVSTQVDLSEVRLQLPRLSIESPPRVLADPRITRGITRGEAAQAPPARLGYDIRLGTSGRSAELLSNLAQRPVPLNLNLQLTSERPVAGYLDVSRFPLELFRRRALLDHFSVSLQSPAPNSELNGLLKVAYADYTISVILLGTVGRPVVRLVSDPPLPEEQLVAVLLFGREIGELDLEQNRSVGETRAALADGAVGLLSLYALASTPIESLGYDALNGVITVKLRVAQGTSLSLGAGAGQLKTLGLRRRLGPHWTIETSLGPRQEEAFTLEERSVAQAFLEWSHRY